MRMVIKFIIAIIALYIISVFLLYLLQEKFIFLNEKLENDYQYTFENKFEEINLTTKDKQTINAILFKVDKPKGVILYFHGNKGSLKRWGRIVNDFTKHNYDIFIMDYRGYGKSTGAFDEKLMYDDAILCFDYLKERYNYDKTIVYGRSLGGTFATKVASVRNPDHLILEAPFYNLMDAVNYHYPLLSADFLLKYKFNTNTFINNVKCKTTIFHGTEDHVVPISSSKKLFDLSQKDNTEYIELVAGTHHNLSTYKEYKNHINMILE